MGEIWRRAGCGLDLDGICAASVCWAGDTCLLAPSLEQVDYVEDAARGSEATGRYVVEAAEMHFGSDEG